MFQCLFCRLFGEHRSVLSDQLASCQDQVQTLQSELTIYQKLLEDVRKSSSHKEAGSQVDGAEGGGAVDGRARQLLEDVSTLREQLDSSIRGNNALADRLRTQLDHTSSTGEGHTSLGGRTFHTRSTVTKAQHTKERGSGDHTHHRSVLTQHTTKTGAKATGELCKVVLQHC